MSIDGWKEGWNVFFNYDVMRGATDVYLARYYRDGTVETVKPVNLENRQKVAFGELFEPTFSFRGHDAKQFLEDLAAGLIENGFRPDEIKASDKQLKATENHLEDMRKLVFKEGYKKL